MKEEKEESEKSEKEEVEDDEDEDKSKKESDEEKDSDEDEESDDDDYDEEEESDEFPEDKEYEDFFKASELNYTRESLTHELEREELKWVVRAEWLESMIEKLSENEAIKGWAPWFQAKLEELADLDVPFKNVEQ